MHINLTSIIEFNLLLKLAHFFYRIYNIFNATLCLVTYHYFFISDIFDNAGFPGFGLGRPANEFPEGMASSFSTFRQSGIPSFTRHRSSSFDDKNFYRPQKQDPPIERDLLVSMEELLHGTTRKLKISRQVLSPDGQTTHNEDKILTVEVKKGWKAGTKITFPKEGDQKPNTIPADIIFVIKDKQHEQFCRDADNNILITVKISLRDALTGHLEGMKIPVPTLDGKIIQIPVNDIMKSGARRRVKGEGLPLPKLRSQRADMLVTIDVVFPKSISKSNAEALRRLLPAE